ncbi:rRNA pseudouridine synthase [bacterium]|nr:rRNA pseudouridine synthase [bacterium]
MKGKKPAHNKPLRSKNTTKPEQVLDPNEPVRLNRYISISGLCSRRKADEWISEGRVKVNGVVVKELGVKVSAKDKVLVDNKLVTPEEKKYVVLNKPKNTICTKSDPEGRKTVIDLLPDDLKHLNPVGRLDRDTTGVIILTNDGDLTQALLHPSKTVRKIYKATLNRVLSQDELNKLVTEVELEDGPFFFDKLAELNEDELPRYGIEIHSGKNRIIRRTFEAIGAQVVKLDRVRFHNIERRGLKRGEWRLLKDKEIRGLGVKPRQV